MKRNDDYYIILCAFMVIPYKEILDAQCRMPLKWFHRQQQVTTMWRHSNNETAIKKIAAWREKINESRSSSDRESYKSSSKSSKSRSSFLDSLFCISTSPPWLHALIKLLRNLRHEDNLNVKFLNDFRSLLFAPFNDGLQHDVSEFLIAMLGNSSAFLNETASLFRGSVTTYTTCSRCSQTSERTEHFRVLSLPIPTSSSNDPPIPLHSLFDEMLTPVLLDGEYECISCAPTRQAANLSFRLRWHFL